VRREGSLRYGVDKLQEALVVIPTLGDYERKPCNSIARDRADVSMSEIIVAGI
jgi:hypothetical protein